MCFLSLLISLSPSLLYSVLSCILPPTPFFFPCTHFPSFFLKAWLSPDRLAGDKTWSFADVRDIWEQDGERDGGHAPSRSPSAGSVEAIQARRWVFQFLHIPQRPTRQHLCLRCQIRFMFCSAPFSSVDSSGEREPIAFFFQQLCDTLMCTAN